MKKLIVLFFSMLVIGSIFQACDDSKTYAEMLEDEKNAVNKYIRDNHIKVISLEEFERNDSTTNLENNEYVAFSNGVYMQIVRKDSVYYEGEAPAKFVNNNNILTRFVEVDLIERDTIIFNVFLPGTAWENRVEFYGYPDEFRYTVSEYSSTTVYGVFLSGVMRTYRGVTDVPAGWLASLPYVRDGAHVKLIVPSKMGHQSAQQEVIPYFYDIREFKKY